VNLDTTTNVAFDVDTAPIGAALDKLADAAGVIARSSAEAQTAQEDFLSGLQKAGQAAGAVLALLAVVYVLTTGKVPGLQVNA